MYLQIEPIVHDKAASMTPDERLLLSVAAKNYIAQDRRTHRTISVIKTYSQYHKYFELLEDYGAKVATRLITKCLRIIDLIDQKVLEVDKNNEDIDSEVFVEFHKMKADFYRYICECCSEEKVDGYKE